MEDSIHSLLDCAEAQCPRLAKLQLGRCYPRPLKWKPCLELSLRLTRLALVGSWSLAWSNAKDWFELPELRELIVKSMSYQVPWTEQLMHFRCRQLESLSWTMVRGSDGSPDAARAFLKSLAALLKEHHWPRFHSLTLDSEGLNEFSNPWNYENEAEELALVLRCCPPLRQLILPKAFIQISAWPAIQGHFQSFEVLELRADSCLTQEVLSSFPQLRTFHSDDLEVYDVV